MRSIIRSALLACLCCMGAVWAQGTSHDPMTDRVLPCTACHGDEGRATPDGYFPRIAGKPAGYLYNQLRNFREGRRSYPPMAYLLTHLTDGYLYAMARHFSELQLPYAAPAPAIAPQTVLERGEALVRHGDATRDVPACQQCHGQQLTGAAPFIPSLLGLSRDYLSSQLGAWRTGQRHAQAPDCMAQVARHLSLDDVQAVAAWLSAQAVPGDGKAAAHAPQALPLRCGSLQAQLPEDGRGGRR